MKPINDIFSTHIQGLYKGHEVAAPGSVQEGVFNQLDAINGSLASGSASGGFTLKAVLGAAVVIVGFAWYLMPVAENQVVVDEAEVVVVEEVVVEEVVVEEVVVEEVVVEEVVVEEVKLTPETDEIKLEVNAEEPFLAEEELQKTVVSTSLLEDAKEEVDVFDATVGEEIIKVVAPTKEVVEIKEVQEPEEVLEWVLPAKLEVDE